MENLVIRNATLKDAKTLEKMSRDTTEIAMAEGRTLGLKYFEFIIGYDEYGWFLLLKLIKKLLVFFLQRYLV